MEHKIMKEHIIINEFDGKIIDSGKHAGIEKNKYWLVMNKNTEETYYIMDCGSLDLVMIDEESIDKIIGVKNSWYITSVKYIATNLDKKVIYMHAFLMNHSGHGKGQHSVDHINRNIYDNRLCNLRITTQSEQNKNKSYKKKLDSKYYKNRPEDMENIDLPRYVEYRDGYGDKEKTRYREFFVLTHPNCPKYGSKNCIVSTKSSSVSLKTKYDEIINKMKDYNVPIIYG